MGLAKLLICFAALAIVLFGWCNVGDPNDTNISTRGLAIAVVLALSACYCALSSINDRLEKISRKMDRV